MKKFLTTEELAKKTRISVGHVRRKVRYGELPFRRIGRRLLFDEAEIEKLSTPQRNNRVISAELK